MNFSRPQTAALRRSLNTTDHPPQSLQLPVDSNPPNSSSSPPRRKWYIDIWIKEPAKNSQSPSSSSSSRSRIQDAYRIIFKDRCVRKHVTICALSCLVLLSLLPLYLVYATNDTTVNGRTYHIFFIFLLLIFIIIFCHSFARTCILVSRIARYGNPNSGSNNNMGYFGRIPSIAGPQGYAQPAYPIHVILARDEEIGLEEGDAQGGNSASEGNINTTKKSTTKVAAPPPAYGLWRNSVRINPNLLYWQRVEAANPSPLPPLSSSSTTTTQPNSNNNPRNQAESSESNIQQPNMVTSSSSSSSISAENRPPSYVSEDGVQYIVEAQPRSTVSHYCHSRANS